MSEQSDTPRTDAMMTSGKAHYMSLDLARALERELATKDSEIERLKGMLETLTESEQMWMEIASDSGAELATLRKQVEEIRHIVETEPELEGAMPSEMFEAVRNDPRVMQEAFRFTVKTTKLNILSRLAALTERKEP